MEATDLPPFLSADEFVKYHESIPASITLRYRYTISIPADGEMKTFMARELTDEELHDMMALLTDAPTK